MIQRLIYTEIKITDLLELILFKHSACFFFDKALGQTLLIEDSYII